MWNASYVQYLHCRAGELFRRWRKRMDLFFSLLIGAAVLTGAI